MQSLPPGMQHGEEADARAQVLRVGGDGDQRFGGGVEQDVVDDRFVLKGDGGQLLRDGKDDVEVFAVEQLGLALLEPLGARQRLALGAVPIAAGAVLDVRVLAVVAPFDDAAQRRRAAGFDGLHQAVLMRRQRVSLPVGGAVLSKDVGQLQGWP